MKTQELICTAFGRHLTKGAYYDYSQEQRSPHLGSEDEDDPFVFGEEIDFKGDCCVWNLTATPISLPRRLTYPRGGVIYSRIFDRSIEFKLEMRSIADARKVKVIQYRKGDEKIKLRYGKLNPREGRMKTIQPEPNPGWEWIAGKGDFKVDSLDTNRCWPQLRRQGKVVIWGDMPALVREDYIIAVNNGDPGYATGPNGDFPHFYKVEFKTDMFCSDQDPCDEMIAQNQIVPIASVSWTYEVRVTVHQKANGKWRPEARVDECKITVRSKDINVYNWCIDSPYRPL